MLAFEQGLIGISVVNKLRNSLFDLLVFSPMPLYLLPVYGRGTIIGSIIPFFNTLLKTTIFSLSLSSLSFCPRGYPPIELILNFLLDGMNAIFGVIWLLCWLGVLWYFGRGASDGVPYGLNLLAMVFVCLPLEEVGVEMGQYSGLLIHSFVYLLHYNNSSFLLSVLHYNLMENDPVILTLLKLKRQNEEITAQKEKINDLKTIKRIKKTAELN